MFKNQTLEDFYLGSLIKDLEEEHKISESPEILSFEQLNQHFIEENTEKNLNKSCKDKLNESLKLISREEIFSLISKQKTGILLQKSIKEMNKEEISYIINELKGFFSKIMKDRNGNYFLKDLFKKCSSQQRIIVLNEISFEFFSLSIHQYSTHPIQCLIELAKEDKEFKIINSLFFNVENFLNMCLNSNGSFVIQKIISTIPENKREIINKLFFKFFKILVCDMYGVCILKKFVMHSINIYHNIIFSLFQEFEKICENQYGNYFAQFILELCWNKKEILWIKNSIIKNFLKFSKNQYASHVCETFINLITPQERKMILKFLIENKSYYLLINDKYGIFVINKLNTYKKIPSLS